MGEDSEGSFPAPAAPGGGSMPAEWLPSSRIAQIISRLCFLPALDALVAGQEPSEDQGVLSPQSLSLEGLFSSRLDLKIMITIPSFKVTLNSPSTYAYELHDLIRADDHLPISQMRKQKHEKVTCQMSWG